VWLFWVNCSTGVRGCGDGVCYGKSIAVVVGLYSRCDRKAIVAAG
jgi:hypothetical protein